MGIIDEIRGKHTPSKVTLATQVGYRQSVVGAVWQTVGAALDSLLAAAAVGYARWDSANKRLSMTQTATFPPGNAGMLEFRTGDDSYWCLVYNKNDVLTYLWDVNGFSAQIGHNTPGTHVLQNTVDVPANGTICGHWAGKTANSNNNYHTYAYALVTATDVTAASMDSTYTISVMRNVVETGPFMQPNTNYVFGPTTFTLASGSTLESADGIIVTSGHLAVRGVIIQGVPAAALADINFVNGSESTWIDESLNSLKFKVKDSGGIIKTAVVPFARPRFDVTEYGAKVDGATDDSTAVNAAGTAASSVGGEVYFPPGTCVAENVTLYTNVRYNGVFGASILKLKASSSSGFLLRGNGASGLMGGSSASGIVNTVVENLILDGNKANNTTGIGIQLYGYGYTFRNLIVRNFDQDGIYSDWNGGQGFGEDGPEAQYENVKVHDCDGQGIRFAGPHDTKFANVVLFRNNLNLYVGPNATACQFSNFHSWSPTTQGVVVEAGYSQWSNGAAEGASGDRANMVILAGGDSISGFHFYGTDGNSSENATGLQLGQTGTTAYGSGAGAVTVTGAKSATGWNIKATFDHCGGTGGALNFVSEANNTIHATFFQNQGAYVGGTPANSTTTFLEVNGLTEDGTMPLSGGNVISNKSSQALRVRNKAGTDAFNVNTQGTAPKVECPNNGTFTVYSSSYSANVNFRINHDAAMGVGWSNSSGTYDASLARAAGGVIKSNGTFADAGVSNAGAIASSATLAVTVSSVAVGTIRCQPAAAVTGTILAVGSTNGQRVTVFNESAAASTITFAASGTSNVADGTSSVIAGLTARTFVWNASTSLWYPAK